MSRPVALPIVAAALWTAAFISLVVGMALLIPGTFLDGMWEYNRPAHAAFLALGKASGIAFLALGIVAGTAGGGLIRSRRWAWWVAVAIFAINGLGDVVGLIKTRDAVRSGSGIVVAAIFLALLLNRRARRSIA